MLKIEKNNNVKKKLFYEKIKNKIENNMKKKIKNELKKINDLEGRELIREIQESNESDINDLEIGNMN